MGRLLAEAGGVYGNADGESARNSNFKLLWLRTLAASLASCAGLSRLAGESTPAPSIPYGALMTGGGGGVLGDVFAISDTWILTHSGSCNATLDA